jgi:outer membrane protein OmpA-like peptidoglycan-associated protein
MGLGTRVARVLQTLSLVSVVAASDISAQVHGGLDLGTFLDYTAFDSAEPFNDAAGAGAALGFYVLPRLSLEAEVSFAAIRDTAGEHLVHLPLRARLLYSQPLAAGIQFLVGPGFVRNSYLRGLDGADYGATGLVGLRAPMGDRIDLRVDGVADYMPAPIAQGVDETWHLAVRAGVSLRLGRSLDDRHRARDVDRDGAADALDACPDTHSGARVEPDGCAPPVDRDGDGVPDTEDQCPGTQVGAAVNPNGCPEAIDSDDDGMPDREDACPGTLKGVPVDARGCETGVDSITDGVEDRRDVPTDGDADGVADRDDACLGTPRGIVVNERGCPAAPEADFDADGVANADDRCPRSRPNEAVDAVGCRILFEGASTTVVLAGVEFVADDRYALSAPVRRILDGVAQWLIAHPDLRIEIAGHTDAAGYRPYQLIRSLGRATAVREYLIDRGVDGSRLMASGYGPDQPIADNATAERRAENERIELRIRN